MTIFENNTISNIAEYYICGYIHCVEKNQIYVRIDKDHIKKLPKCSTNIRYHIHFLANRSVYQLERNAANIIHKYNLSKYFFPEKLNLLPRIELQLHNE